MYITAFEKFWMYVHHCICLEVNKIEALPILKNFYYQSGINVEEKILFVVESHVSTGKEFESK